MSIQGEKCSKKIEEIRTYIEGKMPDSEKDLQFFQCLFDVLDELNMRVQVLERELGPGDAFVDPNEGLHRIR